MISPRRFVAGAVCPKCAEMDRLVTYTNEVGTFKECVSCGFQEKQLVQVQTNELETRVNHFPTSDQPEETDVQVVQLMNPKK